MKASLRRTLFALVACAALLLLAPHAWAIDATGAEVRDLAERAQLDPTALGQLQAVDSVDGRPVDLQAALSTADRAALDARLRSLAQAAPQDSSVDPADMRATARDILSERRFRPTEPPRPFRGVLNTIGDWLDRMFTRPIARALRSLVELIPGGAVTLWWIAGIVVVALVVLVAMRLARRRVRVISHEASIARLGTHRDDPRTLERRAQEAEADGDLATAIRLRFLAGLLRLDLAGAIRYEPSLTTGQVRRTLHLAPFDRVAGSFESVAYGGRPPTSDDVATSKDGWRAVLEGVAA